MIAKSKLAAGHRIEDGILGTQEPKTANVRYWNQISHGVFERRKDFSPKELDLIKEAEEWNKSHGLTEEGFQREKLRQEFALIVREYGISSPEVLAQTLDAPFDAKSYRKAIDAIEANFLERLFASELLIRPPIFLGITLITIGFFLQMLGSVPLD